MSRTRNLGILLALALVGAAAPGSAQTRQPLPIAYISVQRILVEAEAAKAVTKELDALRQMKAQELAEKKKALDDTRLQLANAGGYFSSAKRAQLQDAVKSQEAELQQATQQAQADFQERQRTLQDQLRGELNTVVAAIAAQRGIQYVLNQDASLIMAPQGGNLTDEVLTRLNAATAQREAAAKSPGTAPTSPAPK